jgi:UPF0176 protein
MSTIVIAAFYQFAHLPDYKSMQAPILEFCLKENLRGTILLAEEGINSTLAGSREGVDRLLSYLRSYAPLADLEHKESFDAVQPFKRMKVKLKKEIVTLKQPRAIPTERVGTYVDPKDWNALLAKPGVIAIDVRNDYEVAIGTFKGAMNPNTKTFSEFTRFVEEHLKDKKTEIITCCTGGIRCEKATAYLLDQGYENVYHLRGGILKYLEEIPAHDSLWEGECFVFDQRVSVTHGLELGSYKLCYACQSPLSEEDRRSSLYALGISCPHCHDRLSPEQKKRFANRQHQVEVCALRGETHIGH